MVQLIGADVSAAQNMARSLDEIRAQVLVMADGCLDAAEVEAVVVTCALDTLAQIVGANPDAGEALSLGIVKLLAREYRQGARLTYKQACAAFETALRVSWDAVEPAPEELVERMSPAARAFGPLKTQQARKSFADYCDAVPSPFDSEAPNSTTGGQSFDDNYAEACPRCDSTALPCDCEAN